jgi:transmembrane sensor
LVLAAGAGLAVLAVRGGAPAAAPRVAQEAPRAPDYWTRKGEQKTFVLPDGSRMTLDTDSAVEIAFAPQRRTLRLLWGRGFFDVQHDAARPFAVRAGAREVVALGTRFDVRLDPGRLQVMLVEGRVAVAALRGGAPPVSLRPGQQLVELAGTPPTISAADVEESRNWRQGLVTFHDATLAAATAEINRYSRDRLVVRDPRLARLRVSGVFRAGEAGRFGRTLAQVHPLRLVRTGPTELELVAAN